MRGSSGSVVIAIALLSVVGSTASAAGSRPASRTVDNPTCTLPGIRYVGTVLHGGRLCFTLARNGRAVLEWGATFCPESHPTGGVGSSFAKPRS